MAEALDLGKGKGKGFLFFIRQGPRKFSLLPKPDRNSALGV